MNETPACITSHLISLKTLVQRILDQFVKTSNFSHQKNLY